MGPLLFSQTTARQLDCSISEDELSRDFGCFLFSHMYTHRPTYSIEMTGSRKPSTNTESIHAQDNHNTFGGCGTRYSHAEPRASDKQMVELKCRPAWVYAAVPLPTENVPAPSVLQVSTPYHTYWIPSDSRRLGPSGEYRPRVD